MRQGRQPRLAGTRRRYLGQAEHRRDRVHLVRPDAGAVALLTQRSRPPVISVTRLDRRSSSVRQVTAPAISVATGWAPEGPPAALYAAGARKVEGDVSSR